MKFTLEIELGNSAMSMASDLADALVRVADTVRYIGPADRDIKPTVGGPNSVRDLNGNRVGKWEIVEAQRVKVACALTGIDSQNYKVELSLHPAGSDDMEILRGLAINADDAIVSVREVPLP